MYYLPRSEVIFLYVSVSNICYIFVKNEKGLLSYLNMVDSDRFVFIFGELTR